MGKKAIFANERSVFGDFDEKTLQDPGRSIYELDGYSDKRRNAELERRAGRQADPIPHRFQYLPSQRPNGQPDRRKIAEYLAKGYKMVKYDEAGDYGIDLSTSAAVKDVDGNVLVGSDLLFVAPASVAAREDHFNKQRIDTQVASTLAPITDQTDEKGKPIFTFEEEGYNP